MTGRIRFLLFFITLLFCIITARLFYWQIIRAEELSFLGKTQYGTYLRTLPERGEIKTSDGFPIVTNKLSYLVFVNPKEVKNKQKTTEKLHLALETDIASLSAYLSMNRLWVPIKSKINPEIKEKLEKINLPGVGFEEVFTRFYPEASMASQLIGFVGKNELGEDKGYFGIEGYYDMQLKGKPGTAVQVHDAFGRPILSQMSGDFNVLHGRTLTLSINRSIQFMVEKKLKDGIEKYGAFGGMIGVINPKTGEIIAMASVPSFDQREYQNYSDELYKNPFITNLYEPGSTFKSLVMASAIDSKVVKPDTKCPICEGPVEIGEYQIKTWNNKYYKNINMTDVIMHSDNTGMVYISKMLGIEKMLSYFRKFGIGELTGIDLQGESTAYLKQKERWYPIDIATASFGQGIVVTPIQLLTAFASLANEGKRMRPYLVTKIETNNGKIIKINPETVNQAVSPETAKVITEILVNAVDQGEAKWTKPKGYRVAGKTGTAQIPISGHYDPNKTIASFLGFAPADDPKFAMLVIVDRPTTSIYGAETAAPIFFDIAANILTYYGITPK